MGKSKFWMLFVIGIVVLGCQSKVDLVTTPIPPVFRLGFEPPEGDVEKRITQLRGFAHYLEKKLGIPVELIEISHYVPAIEALRSDKLELVNLGSFAYVIAEEKGGVEPLAYKGLKATGEGSYFSYFITIRPDLNSMEDVRRKASSLKMGYGNPASTSGHLIPKKYLPTLGIDPIKSFKEVLHNPDHTATMMSILAGNLDVAAVESVEYNRFVKTGKTKPDEVKILYQSAPIQTGPYVTRSNLPAAFKLRIQKALTDVDEDAPEIWADISGSATVELALFPAKSELWNDIRLMAKKAKQQMYDLK
jgi:phosphonate transport system substrate-binding protein